METSSGRLRQSSENVRKRSSGLWPPLDQFWKIFGNLRKVVGTLQKIATNVVMNCEHFTLIKRKLRDRLEIRNLSSRAEKQFSTLEDKFRILYHIVFINFLPLGIPLSFRIFVFRRGAAM